MIIFELLIFKVGINKHNVCVYYTMFLICATELKISWASVVWHLSLPLMNSFDKTEAAGRSCSLIENQDTTNA